MKNINGNWWIRIFQMTNVPFIILRNKVCKGFTILELMIVLIIISVAVILAVGSISGSQEKASIHAAAKGLDINLKQIRERALSRSLNHTVVFNDAANSYAVTYTDTVTTHVYTYKLSEVTGAHCHYGCTGIIATSPPEWAGAPPGDGITFPSNTLVFEARGGADAGVIFITNDKQNYAVGINSLGRTKVYVYGKDGQWH
jgi:prepilin-type N-terminal cleavage/methylation domain-containing protein